MSDIIASGIRFYSRKDNSYGWLSNFWRARQIVGGIEYPTNEHYYQSQKATDPAMVEWIRNAPTPYAAMKAGRSLRPKERFQAWDNMKVGIMMVGLRAKFTQNPDLKAKLLATGDLAIHEDSPMDLYWGINGQDRLGKLLMMLREELRWM